MNILLIDDHAIVRAGLRRLLAAIQHVTITEAATGRDALVRYREARPDVVILDVRMHPGPDGFETARLIRGRERSRAIPIIFLTAHDDDLSVEQAYSLGAVDYLVKPVPMRMLVQTVQEKLIPSLLKNHGENSIEEISTIRLLSPVRVMRNYLPFVNMESGYIKKDWPDEAIYVGK